MTRPRDVTDNATPSGTSLAAELLARLADLLQDETMRRRATYVLETIAEPMVRHPAAFGHALGVADLLVRGAIELAIVGDPASEDFRALTRAAAERYVPSLVLAGGPARKRTAADRAARRSTDDWWTRDRVRVSELRLRCAGDRRRRARDTARRPRRLPNGSGGAVVRPRRAPPRARCRRRRTRRTSAGTIGASASIDAPAIPRRSISRRTCLTVPAPRLPALDLSACAAAMIAVTSPVATPCSAAAIRSRPCVMKRSMISSRKCEPKRVGKTLEMSSIDRIGHRWR